MKINFSIVFLAAFFFYLTLFLKVGSKLKLKKNFFQTFLFSNESRVICIFCKNRIFFLIIIFIGTENLVRAIFLITFKKYWSAWICCFKKSRNVFVVAESLDSIQIIINIFTFCLSFSFKKLFTFSLMNNKKIRNDIEKWNEEEEVKQKKMLEKFI